MTNKHPDVENIILPVAGVANWGSGNHSTAAVHFAPLRAYLQLKQHDVPVLSPLVPEGFGVLKTMKDTYQQFEEDVERATDDYPNARILLVAHSLGGLLSRELVGHDQTSSSRYIGAITLGSPHKDLPPTKYNLFSNRVREMNKFADNVTTLWSRITKGPSLALVSARYDVVVPPRSALPPLSRASRYYLSDSSELPSELEGVTLVRTLPIDHFGLVLHPQAIGFTSKLASEMLEKSHASARAPKQASRPIIRVYKTG